MILKAVIVKDKKRKINEIIKKCCFYATEATGDNMSRKISFYKNEEAAKNNYPKDIAGIIHILIDTDNMEFSGKNNTPILSKPNFSETDSEYIFSFDEGIQDLSCKINLA